MTDADDHVLRTLDADDLIALIAALRRDVGQLQTVTIFFASVIKSGEPWTDLCDSALRSALGSEARPVDVSYSTAEPWRVTVSRTGDGHVVHLHIGNVMVVLPALEAHKLGSALHAASRLDIS